MVDTTKGSPPRIAVRVHQRRLPVHILPLMEMKEGYSEKNFFAHLTDEVIADLLEQEELSVYTSANEKNALSWCARSAKYGQFGYVITGIWLQRLRQWKHLWNRKTKSFNDFCKNLLGKGSWYANRIIKAAKVCLALIHRGFKILPTNESQARPLTRYLAENDFLYGDICQEEMFDKWQEVIDTAPSQNVTASHVTSIVDGEAVPKSIKADAKTYERLSRNALDAGMSIQEYINHLMDKEDLPEEQPPEEDQPEIEETEPAKTRIWWEDLKQLTDEYKRTITKESG